MQVDTTKFYTILGINKDATQVEVKKAYLQLAKKVRCAHTTYTPACT